MVPLSWLMHLSSSLMSYANIAALAVFLLVYYSLVFYRKLQKRKNIPPGPKPWPIVGNFGGFLIPSFMRGRYGQQSDSTAGMDAMDVFAQQAKVYGNVYSIFAGSQLIVVLNGYEVVKDALSNHPEVFSDRPDIPAVTMMTKRKGELAFLCLWWVNNRKVCIKHGQVHNYSPLCIFPSNNICTPVTCRQS